MPNYVAFWPSKAERFIEVLRIAIRITARGLRVSVDCFSILFHRGEFCVPHLHKKGDYVGYDPTISNNYLVLSQQKTSLVMNIPPRPKTSGTAGQDHDLSRRSFLKRGVLASTALALGTGLYAWRIEPHWIELTHRLMPLADLPKSLVGKRIVQLSDLHIGPVDNEYLRKVFQHVTALEPDYLVLTGDFMTSEGTEQIDLTIDTLKSLPTTTTPTIATLGNHDYTRRFNDRRTANLLSDKLRGSGIHLLRNESLDIDGLQFAGCDDLWSGQANIVRTFQYYDDSRAGITLAHNPDLADLSGWGPFRGWILSGHTHGGQCRLPLIGAPILPINNRAYRSGHVSLDEQRDIYINRGIGYKHRFRLGARPEVTVFELTAIA